MLYNKKLKRFSAAEANTPEEPFYADCQCRFRNVGAEGFQEAEEDTKAEEDKQTTDGKNEGRAFRGDDAEEQW